VISTIRRGQAAGKPLAVLLQHNPDNVAIPQYARHWLAQNTGYPEAGAVLVHEVLAPDDGAEAQEEQQAAEGHRDQFAETAPGIFGISKACKAYIRLPTEEVLELYNDKRCKKYGNTSEHNRSFSKAEELGDERFFFAQEFFIFAVQRGMKKDSGQDVCNEENITKTEDVFRKCIQIKKQLQERVELIIEDRIRRSQQGRKDRKDRNRNHDTAQDRPKVESLRGDSAFRLLALEFNIE